MAELDAGDRQKQQKRLQSLDCSLAPYTALLGQNYKLRSIRLSDEVRTLASSRGRGWLLTGCVSIHFRLEVFSLKDTAVVRIPPGTAAGRSRRRPIPRGSQITTSRKRQDSHFRVRCRTAPWGRRSPILAIRHLIWHEPARLAGQAHRRTKAKESPHRMRRRARGIPRHARSRREVCNGHLADRAYIQSRPGHGNEWPERTARRALLSPARLPSAHKWRHGQIHADAGEGVAQSTCYAVSRYEQMHTMSTARCHLQEQSPE